MLTATTLLSLVFWSEGGLPAHLLTSREVHNTTVCEKSGVEDLLPAVVGPMVGSRPAWIVDGGDHLWERAGYAVKTLWVFSRTSQTVRIKGTRLDGPGTATFRRGQEDPVSDALVINDPSATSAIPGGASREVMRGYSFIPSHVFYPSPGCWEFVVRIGSQQARIVREIKPAR